MTTCYHDSTVEWELDEDGTYYVCDLCGEAWFEPFE